MRYSGWIQSGPNSEQGDRIHALRVRARLQCAVVTETAARATGTRSRPARSTRWASVRGVGPWPDDDAATTPSCCATATGATSWTRYRYWRLEAIVADLDTRRHPFHVAVENFAHDFNIGSVVRTANAFLAAEVHIVGRRRWNRRGAMVTDRYQHVRHHDSVAEPRGVGGGARACRCSASTTCPGSVPLETYDLPERCVLLLGQEGPGLSPEARDGLLGRAVGGAVRLDPLDQRRRRGGRRDARLGPPARLRPGPRPPSPPILRDARSTRRVVVHLSRSAREASRGPGPGAKGRTTDAPARGRVKG